MVSGTWYDGFLWTKGKQVGVAKMCWHASHNGTEGYFYNPDHEDVPHVQTETTGYKKAFEPNMRST
jgi:hypothetical protein